MLAGSLAEPALALLWVQGKAGAGDAMLAAMRKDGGRKEGRWGIKDGREDGILASPAANVQLFF